MGRMDPVLFSLILILNSTINLHSSIADYPLVTKEQYYNKLKSFIYSFKTSTLIN